MGCLEEVPLAELSGSWTSLLLAGMFKVPGEKRAEPLLLALRLFPVADGLLRRLLVFLAALALFVFMPAMSVSLLAFVLLAGRGQHIATDVFIRSLTTLTSRFRGQLL